MSVVMSRGPAGTDQEALQVSRRRGFRSLYWGSPRFVFRLQSLKQVSSGGQGGKHGVMRCGGLASSLSGRVEVAQLATDLLLLSRLILKDRYIATMSSTEQPPAQAEQAETSESKEQAGEKKPPVTIIIIGMAGSVGLLS